MTWFLGGAILLLLIALLFRRAGFHFALLLALSAPSAVFGEGQCSVPFYSGNRMPRPYSGTDREGCGEFAVDASGQMFGGYNPATGLLWYDGLTSYPGSVAGRGVGTFKLIDYGDYYFGSAYVGILDPAVGASEHSNELGRELVTVTVRWDTNEGYYVILTRGDESWTVYPHYTQSHDPNVFYRMEKPWNLQPPGLFAGNSVEISPAFRTNNASAAGGWVAVSGLEMRTRLPTSQPTTGPSEQDMGEEEPDPFPILSDLAGALPTEGYATGAGLADDFVLAVKGTVDEEHDGSAFWAGEGDLPGGEFGGTSYTFGTVEFFSDMNAVRMLQKLTAGVAQLRGYFSGFWETLRTLISGCIAYKFLSLMHVRLKAATGQEDASTTGKLPGTEGVTNEAT